MSPNVFTDFIISVIFLSCHLSFHRAVPTKGKWCIIGTLRHTHMIWRPEFRKLGTESTWNSWNGNSLWNVILVITTVALFLDVCCQQCQGSQEQSTNHDKLALNFPHRVNEELALSLSNTCKSVWNHIKIQRNIQRSTSCLSGCWLATRSLGRIHLVWGAKNNSKSAPAD